jgi:hypothetical protein
VDGDCFPLSNTDRHHDVDRNAHAHSYRHPAADRNTFPDGNADTHAGANTGWRRANAQGADSDVPLHLSAAD